MRQLKKGYTRLSNGCIYSNDLSKDEWYHSPSCIDKALGKTIQPESFFYTYVDDVEAEESAMNIWINTPEVKEKVDTFLKDATDPFNVIVEKIKELHNKKRADYTGGKHILYNYKTAANFVGLDTYKLILTRIIEKCLRLSVIHENGGTYQVEDEKPDDTSRDIAVLAILLEIARHDSEPSI